LAKFGLEFFELHFQVVFAFAPELAGFDLRGGRLIPGYYSQQSRRWLLRLTMLTGIGGEIL